MYPTLIPSNIPPRTKKVGDSKIYLDPRISANQLAQYLVSDHSRQESIVRDARMVSKIRVANYQPARVAVPKCYDGDGLNATALLREATRMETANFSDEFETACNKLSAAAVRKLAVIVADMKCQGNMVPHSAKGFDHLLIENVRVSVQPEIVFSTVHRGMTKYGGMIINYSKGEYSSLAKVAGKYRAGDYAAFLLFQMLALRFGRDGGPLYSRCFAVDIHRDTIYPALASHITMLRNVQAACRTIALQWSAIASNEAEALASEEDAAF